MDEVSSVLIKSALDGLATRQVYTAQNIANVSSPDYVPVQVDFEGSLVEAASQGVEAVKAMTAQISQRADPPGSSELRIDLELATAAQTAMRYGALIDLMGRQMSMTMSVVRGGQ